MEQTENPNEELIIEIGKNSYKIKFPDTGMLLDLEKAKSRISFPNSRTDSAIWAYNLGGAIETFRLLIPKMEDDMNVKNFDRLSLMESRSLVKAYVKDFLPWFNDWMNVILSVMDDPTEDAKKA